MILALLPLAAETDLVWHGGSGKAKAPSEEAVCFGSSAGSWSQDSNHPARAFCLAKRAGGTPGELLQHQGPPPNILGKPEGGGCLPLHGGELLEWDEPWNECTLRHPFSGVCQGCVCVLPLWSPALTPGDLTCSVGWDLGNVAQSTEQGEFGEPEE